MELRRLNEYVYQEGARENNVRVFPTVVGGLLDTRSSL